MVETQFDVGMTCDGRANAIKHILGKIDGVESIDCNVDSKKVTVQADEKVSPQFMLEKLQKWSAASGKPVALAS